MSDKMADIIKQAAAASKHAPEHLQEAAFQKVFDALMAEAADEPASGGKPNRKKAAKKKATRATKTAAEDDGPTLDDLDRTAHLEINHKGSGLDNALRLLRAAREDLDIDGLTATEIANALTDKFRSRISQQAVSNVLNDAGKHVDRKKNGNKVVFRIMDPGEEHLDEGPGETPTAPKKRKAKKKANSSVKKKSGKKKTKKKAKKKAKKKVSKKKSIAGNSNKKPNKKTVGPATVLSQLLDNGFLSSPRTIADIIQHAKHVHGRTIKANDLSPALLRFLRSGKLTRERNAEEQYEYQQA